LTVLGDLARWRFEPHIFFEARNLPAILLWFDEQRGDRDQRRRRSDG